MITSYLIDNISWTPITAEGMTGKCWLDFDSDDSAGKVDIRICQSETIPSDAHMTDSPRVFKPNSNSDYMELKPSTPKTIFYARAFNFGDQATLLASFYPNSTDIFIQDQSTNLIDRFLTFKLADVTLATPTVIESRTITLVAEHGFIGNGEEMIEITEGSKFYQSRVISLNVNTITVTNPQCFVFTINAIAKRVSPNANVLGSAGSPVIFSAMPPAGVSWDVNILSVNILDQTIMDDSKLGGMTALTNGVVFRTKNGTIENIFTVIDNSCFIRHCDTDNPYSDKAPAGFYGLNTKRRFNGQQGDGVSRRLVGDNEGQFQAVIADDLRPLNRFWIVIRGHVVE